MTRNHSLSEKPIPFIIYPFIFVFLLAGVEMASSEKVDSGRFPGGRSNFSQTCSLLSQYLKEKGSFGDLSLSLSPNFAETKGTMNLFPKIEQLDQNSGIGIFNMKENMLPQLAAGGEQTLNISDNMKSGQMTVFYAGEVMVFDDIPADKANEIMTLATKYCRAAAIAPPPHTAQKPAESAITAPNIRLEECGRHPPLPALASDLPIARKNSLARFLEKRKDRISGKAPYQASKPVAKPVKTETWLELGSQFPFQIQRH